MDFITDFLEVFQTSGTGNKKLNFIFIYVYKLENYIFLIPAYFNEDLITIDEIAHK